MTFEVQKGNTTVRGVGYIARGKSNSSKALDRTGVVLPQPTLDAVIEGRSRSIKEWGIQERAGVG